MHRRHRGTHSIRAQDKAAPSAKAYLAKWLRIA